MNAQVTPEIRPYVAMLHGQIKTTSTKIAEHFGKRHDTVLRAIQNLECSSEFNARNFAEIQIDVDLGLGRIRKSPAFEITRDGFTFLAMGFTGKRAAIWKESYIDAFNQMEKLIRRSVTQLETLSRYQIPIDVWGQNQSANGYLTASELFKVEIKNRPLSLLLKHLKEDGCVIDGADAEYQAMNNLLKVYQKEIDALKLMLNRPLLCAEFFGGYAV